MKDDPIIPDQRDPWHQLRQLTPARIALGRAGGSLPTAALLDFQLAHAMARDAVQCSFDAEGLAREMAALGEPVVQLKTAASDRQTYLLRPDLGRQLAEESRDSLRQRGSDAKTVRTEPHPPDTTVSIVVS